MELFQWLHAMGLVVGDLSQANVLWSLEPGPAVHLLDCDGVRITGRPAVLDQADTPDWLDPHAPPGAGGPYGTRPDLGQWRAALAGRDTIRLLATRPAPRPTVDRSRFDGDANRQRGTINLRD
ncbi:hypothetical protein ACIPPS_30115 [Streptomyces sp. NPDC090127]|uniref:hypothetical protein n=1 Tax=Streptomyces sp. NPDC090127 TaxID=3365953 RepID=UPI00382F04A3